MPSAVLSLFPPQALRRTTLHEGWRLRQAPASAAEEALFVRPDFDDADWSPAAVPKQLAAAAGDDTVWYRRRFTLADARHPAHRYLLRCGGSFLETEVWLNGVRLGGHYGYFAPFAFDVTDHLQAGENVLAIRARSTPEQDNLKGKKHVLGIFADWDCKPYPNHALADPPAGRVWTVPLGLWREVTLEETGPVVVDWLHLAPEFADADWAQAGERLPGTARLRAVVALCNLADRPLRLELHARLTPANFVGDDAVDFADRLDLSARERRLHEFTLVVPNPALWWPWTHGEPRLYRLQLTGDALDAAGQPLPSFDLMRTCGLREVKARYARTETDQRWEWWLNGRRLFPKGSNYVAEYSLDLANAERYAQDLALAREANVDFLRVHAHVEKEEFYQLADEQGFLVMCDFPLIFCYVFARPAEEQTFFRQAVLAQVPEMVNLLHHHPSIVLWSIHNEPPWPPDMYWFGEPHKAQTNREVDLEAWQLVQELDPSRPAIAASGEFDEHLYHGWYHSSLYDTRTLKPIFPTEFGTQALPNRDSPFWQTVATTWPIDPEDDSWRYADYQPVQWAQHGVGEPAAFASLEDYIAASQEYQAFYCRYVIDHWRASKFQPTGGLVHFMFTDCWPAISWSVVDYYRLPKAAYHTLKQVYSPAHVCILFDGEYSLRDRARIAYRRGEAVRLRLHLVNDDYRLGGRATLTWRIDPRPDATPFLTRLLLRLRKGLRGRHEVELPAAAGGAVLALKADRRLPCGSYVVTTELRQGDRLLDRNAVAFCVDASAERPRRVRRLPGFAARRLYNRRSLRNTDRGASFCLRNEIQDATAEGITFVRVDGAEVPLERITIDAGSGPIPANTIARRSPLIVRRGALVTLHLDGVHLAPGPHNLEVSLKIAGLGEGILAVRDHI